MTETGTTKPMRTPLDIARELAGWGFVVLPAFVRWAQVDAIDIDAIDATVIDTIDDIAIDAIDIDERAS